MGPILCLVSGLVLLCLVMAIAVGVKQRTLFVKTDARWRDALHTQAMASPGVTGVFAAITELASLRALAAEGAAGLLLLLVLRRWRASLVWILALAGIGIALLLKMAIDRPRPVFDDPLVMGTSKSFPSVHAVGAAIVFGMLAYFSIRALPRRWLLFVTLFGSLIALIGFSRAYLGAHWLSDVIGGWAFGFAWILFWIGASHGACPRGPAQNHGDKPRGSP
jgi:membrane-associated phospholipid phosphatase